LNEFRTGTPERHKLRKEVQNSSFMPLTEREKSAIISLRMIFTVILGEGLQRISEAVGQREPGGF